MFKLYNGCPNRELQDHLDSIDSAKAYIKSQGLLICYYPLEGKWHMAVKDTYKLIADFFNTPIQAAEWVRNNYTKEPDNAFSYP